MVKMIAQQTLTDERSVRKEVVTPGSVRGDAGKRIRAALDALGLLETSKPGRVRA